MKACSNRMANTIGLPGKAGTFTKEVKPATACKKANYSRDTIYIGDDSSRTARISRKVTTVEKSALCGRNTGCQILDARNSSYRSPQLMSFRTNSRKTRQESEKFTKKTIKKNKNCHFSYRF
jgi:hypothetical protein